MGRYGWASLQTLTETKLMAPSQVDSDQAEFRVWPLPLIRCSHFVRCTIRATARAAEQH